MSLYELCAYGLVAFWGLTTVAMIAVAIVSRYYKGNKL